MIHDFSSAIYEAMPLVKSNDAASPFIIYRAKESVAKTVKWFTEYPYPAEAASEWLAKRRESDPYAGLFTGADFDGGSYPFVFDTVFCARLRAELRAEQLYGVHAADFEALANVIEDNIGGLSQATLDALLAHDTPLLSMFHAGNVPAFARESGEPYDVNQASAFIDKLNCRYGAEAKSRANVITAEGGHCGGKPLIDGRYREQFSVPVAGREVIFAADEMADKPYLVCTLRTNADTKVPEYLAPAATNDYLLAMREFVGRVDTLLTTLEMERDGHTRPQPKAAAQTSKPAKASILSELDEAKSDAADYNAAHAPANERKRGGQEV